MSRVATINAELEEVNNLIITIDKDHEGKAITGDAEVKFKETLLRFDALTKELAIETDREKAVRKAAEFSQARKDAKAVNIQHSDPDRTPGRMDVPESFRKAFGGFESAGDAFVNSPEFKSALEAAGIKLGEPHNVPSGAPVRMAPATVTGVSYKTLVTSATGSAGYMTRPTRLPNILEILREPIRVTDVFPSIPVSTDTIEYVKESSFTNNAAVVPEATTTTDDAALKPESELVLTLIQDTLEQIAHLIPATRKILADAPQLRAYIDTRLRVGLLEKLETNVVAAVYAASGLLVQARGTDTQLDALYNGQKKVRVTGKAAPESYIMHPNDLGDIRLAKDVNGGYLMGPPTIVGPATIWGLPVVETQWATEGTPLVGDWSMFGALYEREQIQTYVTDSHKDWFQRNLIAILMELRAKLAIYRATAGAKITGF